MSSSYPIERFETATTNPPLIGTKSSPDDNDNHRYETKYLWWYKNSYIHWLLRGLQEKPRFGRVDDLIPFIPQADPAHHNLERNLAKRHIALGIQSFFKFCVLAINLGVLCWLTSRYGTKNGSGTIFTGKCDTAATLNTWLHLAINVFSTILLGCSNYCMQLLSSPTRE